MREQQTKRLFGGAPIVGDVMPYTTIRLPVNDRNGNALYFDASRWIPGGDIFEQREGSAGLPGLPAPLQPGGLWVDAIANYMFKVDPFTGQKLEDLGVDEDSTLEITKHFAKRLPPNIPFIPGTFANKKWAKARRVSRGEVDGEQVVGSQYVSPDTPFLAFAYGFGFKLRPQDATVNERVKRADHQREMDALEQKRNRVLRDTAKGNITPEEQDNKLIKIQEDIITLNAEYELYEAKLRELQSKQSERNAKSKGGIVEGEDNVPFTKEDPADRINPYTGEPYQEQMDRLGFDKGGPVLPEYRGRDAYEKAIQKFAESEKDAQLLREFAWVESKFADDPTTFRKDNRSAYQITPTRFNDLKMYSDPNRKKGAGMRRYINKIKKEHGTDLKKISYDDLNNPEIGTAATRALLKLIPDPIGETPEQRAVQWKKDWNTELGAGTVEKYLTDLKYLD